MNCLKGRMIINLHDIVLSGAQQFSTRTALKFKSESITYLQLAELVQAAAATLQRQGLSRQERVAVYLPKQFETVTTLFASSICGGVFVPVNPALKPTQVQHILQDCNVRILVTSQDRFISLQAELALCPDLRTVLLVDVPVGYQQQLGHLHIAAFHQPAQMAAPTQRVALTDADMAAILYTSGSTG